MKASSSASVTAKDLYLYEIPLPERHNLCSILDELNVWHELAVKHMGYQKSDLQDLNRAIQAGKSPSDELLTMWGEQNHTVTELFIIFYRMQQYTAMDAIRNLVEKKYHRLIMLDQPALSKLISNLENKNLNLPSEKQIQKDSESKKILNCSSSILSNSNNERSSSFGNDAYHKSVEGNLNIKSAKEYASTIPQIDYMELVRSTNNWDGRNILGKGGFGTVFKGVWKCTTVAIKKIEYHGSKSSENNKIQIEQSLNELKYLNACRHDNILPLYGYCINGDEPCIVYQLMSGGSLEQRLSPKSSTPLEWRERLNIAIGTARGLQFLHTFKEKPLIHGDIKPANILLDSCNQPKIGDFGLAREGPNTLNSPMEVSKVYGTKPYLPIEFLGYKCLSTKVDTYSFGVVLLELATGLRAYDKSREYKFLTKYAAVMDASANIGTLIDKNLPQTPEGIRVCSNFLSLGLLCIAEKPEQRPEMVMALKHLEN